MTTKKIDEIDKNLKVVTSLSERLLENGGSDWIYCQSSFAEINLFSSQKLIM